MAQSQASGKPAGKRSTVRLAVLQIVLSLVLSAVFSAVPFVSALLFNKSSVPLAVFMAWYAFFPPLIILLYALWANRNEAAWLRAAGLIWIDLSTWFLLQYLFSAIAGASMILRLMALPAILSGNTLPFLIGGLLLLGGGLAFYFTGPRVAAPAARPAVAWTALSIILAIIIIALPVFIAVTANPARASVQANVPTTDRIFKWISEVYNLGDRRPGSEADHQAIAYLESELKKCGFSDVKVEKSNFDYWEPLQWELTLQPGTAGAWQAETFYVPYSGPTGKEGVTSEVVYLGNISSPKWQDVKDKIVLVDIPSTDIGWDQMKIFSYMAYEPENKLKGVAPTPYPVGWMLKYIDFYKQAETRHPAAIIGILKNYPDMGKLTYYAPYDGELRPIPSLYVKQDTGEKIKALAGAGKLSAKVVLQAKVAKQGGESANVYGVLPGRSETTLIFHSHHDAPWKSGVEDSSGVGMVMGLADYYAGIPAEQRPYTMIFMFTGGHMVGAATDRDFIARHKSDILSRTLFDIVIEHVADDYLPPSQPSTGASQPRGVFLTENPVAISIFAGNIASHNIDRTLLFPTGSPLGVPTDGSPFQKAGVPIVSLISGPAWLFDEGDTLDRVPKAQLEPLTRMYIDFVSSLAATPEWLLRFNLAWAVLGLLVLILTPLAALYVAFKRK